MSEEQRASRLVVQVGAMAGFGLWPFRCQDETEVSFAASD
jgi:hypothetical protein